MTIQLFAEILESSKVRLISHINDSSSRRLRVLLIDPNQGKGPPGSFRRCPPVFSTEAKDTGGIIGEYL
jgi:hypothetical protein